MSDDDTTFPWRLEYASAPTLDIRFVDTKETND
jgi:hypothetical protein